MVEDARSEAFAFLGGRAKYPDITIQAMNSRDHTANTWLEELKRLEAEGVLQDFLDACLQCHAHYAERTFAARRSGKAVQLLVRLEGVAMRGNTGAEELFRYEYLNGWRHEGPRMILEGDAGEETIFSMEDDSSSKSVAEAMTTAARELRRSKKQLRRAGALVQPPSAL